MRVLILKEEGTSEIDILLQLKQEKINIKEIYIVLDQGEAISLLKNQSVDVVAHQKFISDFEKEEFEKQVEDINPNCRVAFICSHCEEDEYLDTETIEEDITRPEIQELITREKVNYFKEAKSRRVVCTHQKQMLKKRFAVRLMNQNTVTYAIEHIREAGIPWFPNDIYQVVLIKFKSQKEMTNIHMEKALHKFEKRFANFEILCEISDGKRIFAIFRIATELALKTHDIKLEHNLNQFINEIEESGLIAGISVSEKKQGLDQIPLLFQDCKKIEINMFWYGFGAIYKNILPADTKHTIEEDIYNKFSFQLLKKNQSQILIQLNKLNGQLRSNPDQNPDRIVGLYYTLALYLKEHVDTVIFKKEWNREIHHVKLWKRISKCETLFECSKYLNEQVTLYFEKTENLMYRDKRIYEIVSCIQENISDSNLSVEFIATRVYLSPTYLSTVFKKKTDYTIKQFITEKRIEKSKELLKSKKTKLQHIATAVGYNDANYFSKIFSKHTGITPSEYRDKFISVQ